MRSRSGSYWHWRSSSAYLRCCWSQTRARALRWCRWGRDERCRPTPRLAGSSGWIPSWRTGPEWQRPARHAEFMAAWVRTRHAFEEWKAVRQMRLRLMSKRSGDAVEMRKTERMLRDAYVEAANELRPPPGPARPCVRVRRRRRARGRLTYGLHPRPLEGPGPEGQGQALAGQVPSGRPREGRRLVSTTRRSRSGSSSSSNPPLHRGQWVDPTDRTTVAEYARPAGPRAARSIGRRPAARVNREHHPPDRGHVAGLPPVWRRCGRVTCRRGWPA